MKNVRLPIFTAFLIILGAGQAAAQQPDSLGSFRDWGAYKLEQVSKTICYAASQPTADEGDYTQRGDIWVLVTHRNPDGADPVVSFVMGYNVKEGSDVTVRIGDRAFELFGQGDKAWAVRDSDDVAIVERMKAGIDMTVVGYSWRDTKTTDTYSLLGFTNAYTAARQACGY